MALLQLLVMIVCTSLLLVWLVYASIVTFNSAPFLPSNRRAVRAAITKYAKDRKTFVDAGCGDGRIVLMASKLGLKATGIDINPFLTLLSRTILRINRVTNAHILQADLFKHNYSDYDIIYLYLLPDTMNKLLPRVVDTAKPGTIIISNTFLFKELSPIEIINERVNIYQL